MRSVTNISNGPRGINTNAGLVMIDAGKSAMVDLSDAEAAAISTEWFAFDDAADQDGEGEGETSEDVADEAPSLTNKNKAELLEIAAAEGVTVEDGATNAEIKAAIEAGRGE